MKKLFTLIALCAFFAGCNTDDPTPTSNESLTIEDSMLAFSVNGDENTVQIKFTATTAWTASMDNTASNWLTMPQLHGAAGEISTTIDTKANATNAERKGTITLKAGTIEKVITITQAAQASISIDQKIYDVAPAGGEIIVQVQSNADFTCTPSESWITLIDKTPTALATFPPTVAVRFRVEASSTDRGASIKFVYQDVEQTINVVQGYASTDFSQDGQFYKLQSATEGNGINIILMGDAYSDRKIADGTYKAQMEKAMEAFFSAEPYKSFRNMFNIHVVNAVSKYESYIPSGETAFNCTLTNKVLCNGDQHKCLTYAKKISGITGQEIEKSIVIVLMNLPVYAGTCYLSAPVFEYASTYGNGTAIAFFPTGTDDNMFREILVHEAGGHAFPKLTDEYRYTGHVTDADLKQCNDGERYGWFKNISVTNLSLDIKWSTFLSDPRYANDGVGIFEGGRTFITGLYRPSKESIMSNNKERFNAPSREAIYYRIHRLAYGSTWQYDYEKFVEYDAINRISAQSAPRMTNSTPYIPLPSPVIKGL